MLSIDLSEIEQQKESVLASFELNQASCKQFQDQIASVSELEKEQLGKQLYDLLSKRTFDDTDGADQVRDLILAGADISYLPEQGDFPLYICARNNYFKSFCYLLRAGAPLDQVNAMGSSPIMISAKGNQDIVVFLLLLGANVNLRDEYGNNAIMYARKYNRKECFELLLLHGAYINNRNFEGKTIFDIETGKSAFPLPIDIPPEFIKPEERVTYGDLKKLVYNAHDEVARVKGRLS